VRLSANSLLFRGLLPVSQAEGEKAEPSSSSNPVSRSIVPLLDRRSPLLGDDQQHSLVPAHLADLAMGVAQQRFNFGGRAVAESQPEDLRRPSLDECALGKVGILGDNRVVVLSRVGQNQIVRSSASSSPTFRT